MNKTLELYNSIDSSEDNRLSTSDIVPIRRIDKKLHQSLDVKTVATSGLNTTNNLFYKVPNNDYMWK